MDVPEGSIAKKPKLDIVIPVFNNGYILRKSITKQVEFFRKHLQQYTWRIIIMDNSSTDNTKSLGKQLAQQYPEVNYSFIRKQGRGIALRTAWSKSNADFLSYMDVDLSTNLADFPKLIAQLSRESDLAAGSKYLPGSNFKRSWLRLFLSRAYNKLTKIVLGINFTDAQCGFKALTQKTCKRVLPLVKDNFWFFDTELLYFCEKSGMQIAEIPVTWHENKKSGVNLLRTSIAFFLKLIELRFRTKNLRR